MTFGLGHIVNLFNGSGRDLFSTVMQIVFAVLVGLVLGGYLRYLVKAFPGLRTRLPAGRKKGGNHMKKLFDAATRYLQTSDWLTIAVLKFCLISLGMMLGMAVGTLVMTVFGSAFNAIYLLPKFAELFGMPLDVIVGMGTKVNSAITSVSTLVLFAVVPFNLLKGVIVSFLTFLLYKRISPLLHKGDEKKRAKRAA